MERFKAALRRLVEGARSEELDERELDDLGLSRADLEILRSGLPGARARLEAMAARFGLRPADIDADRGIALELAEACAHCGQARTCMRAIETGVELDPDHCPNAGIYRALASSK